jgi:cysteine desulfurase
MPARELGDCDYVTGAAHKFGGPRGVGFLKIPHKHKVSSLLYGGKQERGQRAGTENVPTILAMLAALEVREKQMSNGDHQTRAEWKEKFEKLLLRHVHGSKIVGANSPRLWNTTSALMPEGGQQRWVTRLDKAGYAVSTGSAFTTGKEEPSHVLSAMGFKASEVAHVLRFSGGWETTAADWEELEKGIVKVYGEVHGGK